MEQQADRYKGNMSESSTMTVLDYLFGEGEDITAYQLVRLNPNEPWLVLDAGILIATLVKFESRWVEVEPESLDFGLRQAIGQFIDSQHFNYLPHKIKKHWPDVQEVLMQTDSNYMIISRTGTDFAHFKKVFPMYISNLVEDEWPVEFKVYNAEFTDEFITWVYP